MNESSPKLETADDGLASQAGAGMRPGLMQRRVSCAIGWKEQRELEAIAEAEQRTVAEVVREAVTAWLQQRRQAQERKAT